MKRFLVRAGLGCSALAVLFMLVAVVVSIVVIEHAIVTRLALIFFVLALVDLALFVRMARKSAG